MNNPHPQAKKKRKKDKTKKQPLFLKDSESKTAGHKFNLVISFTKSPSAAEQIGQVSETQSVRPWETLQL